MLNNMFLNINTSSIIEAHQSFRFGFENHRASVNRGLILQFVQLDSVHTVFCALNHTFQLLQLAADLHLLTILERLLLYYLMIECLFYWLTWKHEFIRTLLLLLLLLLLKLFSQAELRQLRTAFCCLLHLFNFRK